ncbi:MAG: DUF6325 family protein [Candidatus Nanopelagicales bacterium]
MEDELLTSGPIDYIVVEWPEHKPTGEAFAELLDLVERGLIRVLDLAFVRKQDDGSIVALTWQEVGADVPEIAVFDGVSSGLIGEEDFGEISQALEPDQAAAVLLYENVWAAPFATAVRRSGGQLVASGRIPVQAVLAALGVED